jgi:hypothetical protein
LMLAENVKSAASRIVTTTVAVFISEQGIREQTRKSAIFGVSGCLCVCSR